MLSNIAPGYGTPVASLVLNAVVVLILNLAPLETLVESDMLLTVTPVAILFLLYRRALLSDLLPQCVGLYIEFASFLWLRHKWAHVHRFFKVPWGWFGAILITIPKVGLITWLCVTADATTWEVATVINGALVILCFVSVHGEFDESRHRDCNRCVHCPQALYNGIRIRSQFV